MLRVKVALTAMLLCSGFVFGQANTTTGNSKTPAERILSEYRRTRQLESSEVIDLRPEAICKRFSSRHAEVYRADPDYFKHLDVETLESINSQATNCVNLAKLTKSDEMIVFLASLFERQQREQDKGTDIGIAAETRYSELVQKYNDLVREYNGLVDRVREAVAEDAKLHESMLQYLRSQRNTTYSMPVVISPPQLPQPRQPIHCTTSNVGSFSYTNCY